MHCEVGNMQDAFASVTQSGTWGIPLLKSVYCEVSNSTLSLQLAQCWLSAAEWYGSLSRVCACREPAFGLLLALQGSVVWLITGRAEVLTMRAGALQLNGLS